MKFEYKFKTTTGESGTVKVESNSFDDAKLQAIDIISKNYKIKEDKVEVHLYTFDSSKITPRKN